MLGIALAVHTRRRDLRWPFAWTNACLHVVRFQVGSLACWVLLSLAVAVELNAAGVAPLAAIGLLPVAGMVVGLRAWHSLQAAISHPEPGRVLLTAP